MSDQAYISDRDRVWALQMMHDWRSGHGRWRSRFKCGFTDAWVAGKLSEFDIQVERWRNKEALNPRPPF